MGNTNRVNMSKRNEEAGAPRRLQFKALPIADNHRPASIPPPLRANPDSYYSNMNESNQKMDSIREGITKDRQLEYERAENRKKDAIIAQLKLEILELTGRVNNTDTSMTTLL